MPVDVSMCSISDVDKGLWQIVVCARRRGTNGADSGLVLSVRARGR